MKNKGVILGSRPTDYIGGTLPYEVRNSSGDWRPYLPVGEIQRGSEDWMDCVTRSATNTIEIQEKFLTGIESNYCDREVALGSGTTREGNYLYKVSEYIRKTGLAQQATWPDSQGGWNEQYTPPRPPVRAQLDAEKKDWLSKWDIKDEDIPFTKKSLQYHLKHAPIQVVVPGHAVVDIFSQADVEKIMDSYPPYVKGVPTDYPYFVAAKKIVLYKRETAIPDSHLLVDIKYLDGGKQVEKLKSALNKLGWLPVIPQGGYDKELVKVVFNFQKANLPRTGWAFWLALFYNKGTVVDSATREVINTYLSNIRGIL